jgi:hypothetical protein
VAEEGQLPSDIPRVRGDKQSVDVMSVLVDEAGRRVPSFSELVQLGHQQRRRTGDGNVGLAGVFRVERRDSHG